MKHKPCAKCGEEKPLTDFAKDNTKTLGVSSSCKDCRNAHKRDQYQADKSNDERRKRFADKVRRRNNAEKDKAVRYKGGKCVSCGVAYPSCVFDFHHVDPLTKEGNLRDLLRKGFDAAKDELDKCVLLCANCHRLHHFKDLNATID